MRAAFVPTSVGAFALLALSSLLVGCGATGLAWVDQPENTAGPIAAEQQQGAVSRTAPIEPIPASADEQAVENHQRLDHTITLGEVDASSSTPDGAAPNGPPPSVSVTINNYGQSGYAPYGGGYYSYGTFARGSRSASFGQSRVTGASRPSSGGVQAGQNWPSIGDHGSSFPYRSAPAAPWSPSPRQ